MRRRARAEAYLLECSQPAVKPIDRSLLYVAELLHRVQNEYTSAISFTSMIASRSPNPEAKAALSQVIDHLHALAKVHYVLFPPFSGGLVDFTDDLTQLCQAIVSADLDRRGVILDLAVSGPILIDGSRSWRANLILSELITNASRHAFGRRGGRISVVVMIATEWIVCRVSDDGSAAAAPRPGVGTQLIYALISDLEADLERTYSESGTVVTLSFPMSLGSVEHHLIS
jgi:two-component sensor histidine kinase